MGVIQCTASIHREINFILYQWRTKILKCKKNQEKKIKNINSGCTKGSITYELFHFVQRAITLALQTSIKKNTVYLNVSENKSNSYSNAKSFS